MFLTPEKFLSLYKIIYESDESIGRIKQTSFVINSNLIVFGILGNIVSFCVFLQKKLLEIKFNSYLIVVTSIKLI